MIPMTLTEIASAIGANGDPGYQWQQVCRVTTDSRDVKPGDLFFAISGERFDGHDFVRQAAASGAVACVCSREFAAAGRDEGAGAILAVDDTIEALGALAVHYRRSVMTVGTVVVAVTGSNGKTTTKCMLDHALKGSFPGRAAPRSFNNKIGVPLTLLSAEADDRFLIVEIGTNAPGEVAWLATMVEPDAAIISSIGEAHLQGLGSVQGVAREKASLLGHVRPHGFAAVNVDRREILPYLKRTDDCRVVTYGLNPTARLRVAKVRGTLTGTTFELEGRYTIELPMPGLHHATNAAAAFATARWLGVAPAAIIRRLGSFTPPEGRTRSFKTGSLTVIDDTYNANPASMLAAIATFKAAPAGRRVFVMGDMLELGPRSQSLHRQVLRAVYDAGIETLVVVGPATAEAVEAIDSPNVGTRTIVCPDAAAASDVLLGSLSPGDSIWIKGSRLVQLDRVVSSLQRHYGSKAAVA